MTIDAAELWRDLCEKSDRTSPCDRPETALINQAEFFDYLATIRAEATLAATLAERKRCERAAQPFVLAAAGSEHELGCNYAATEIVAAIRRAE